MVIATQMRGCVIALATSGALAACGGGGGGGSVPGNPPTPVPTQAPGPPGYVTPTGAVTLVGAAVPGALTSGLVASSTDGVLLAQSPATPTQPPSGGTLAQYPVTASETTAVVPGSVRRRTSADPAAAARRAAFAREIAGDRAAAAADSLREMTPKTATLRRLFRGVAAHAATRTGANVRSPRAAAGTVGSTRQFMILTSNIGNSGGCSGGTQPGQYQCNVTITATLEAAGAHGNVWVDNASLATAGEFTNVPAEFQTVAADFDAYYAVETAAYGPAFFPGTPPVTIGYTASTPQCDPNGNVLPAGQQIPTDISGSNGTSIDIVITDALAGTGEGGYYDVVNEFPQQVWNCAAAPKPVSNNTSMFVITGNNYLPVSPGLPQFNETYWLNTDVPRGMSHELQHLLHAHDKVLYPEITGTGSGTFDEAFIDEGCSMLAEDLATDPAPGQHLDTPRYTYTYMLEPSLYSLTAFTAYQPNPTSTTANPPYGFYSNTAGSYGQAYLFTRYLYDRFGAGALKRIYASTAAGTGPAVAAANGEAFPQLYREFAAALAAQDSPAAQAPYAFSSAVVLRGTTTVPSRRSPPLNIRTLTFGGPQPPEQFSANQPTAGAPLGPGATTATFVIDGATLFVPAANGPTGAYLSVGGGAFPLEQGALVQGALPTPVPSSH